LSGGSLAANKRKILETARKLAQKGAKDKALKEYQKLVKLDPKDAKLRLEIGDAYRRWGQVDEAIDTYSKVADQYTKEGFDARAVAVFKQILNLDPARYESYQPLAELYERMGLTSEAISAFQMAADGFHKQGKKREALELLRKMATIDPTNTTSRIKVAELLRQEELHEEAIAEYDQVAQELERQGDVESTVKVFKRILEIEPDRTETLVQLARTLLGRNDAAQAEPFASHLLETADKEPDHYELLADVYRAQNKDEEMAGVYRRLADLYRERGDEDRARDIQQRYVPTAEFSAGDDEEPEMLTDALDGGGILGGDADAGDELLGGDADAGDELLGGDADAGDEILGGDADAGDELLLESDMIEADGDSSLSAGIPALETEDLSSDPIGIPEMEESATPVGPALQASSTAASAPEPLEEVDAEQILAEASVYLRYGKRDKAIAHLERILAGEPDHRLALEKLGEAYVESGEHERAVEYFVRSFKCAEEEGDDAAVDVLRARIAALDPDAAALLDPQPEIPPEPEPEELPDVDDLSSEEGADDAALDTEFDEGAIEIDIDVEDEFEAGSDEVPGEVPEVDEQLPATEDRAVADVADASISGASLSSAATQQVLDDLEEADFYMEQNLLDEAEAIYQRVLAVAPNHPRALARLGEVAAQRGSDAPVVEAAPSEAAAAPPIVAEETAPEVEGEVALAESDGAPDSIADDLADLDIDDDMEVETPTEDAAEDSEDGTVDASIESAAEAADASVESAPEPRVEEHVAAPHEEAEPLSVDEPAAAAPAEPAPVLGVGFDLAAELSGAFDDATAGSSFSGGSADDGFSAVFEAFKQGVSETVSEGDHDTHYDLGIAYKEMGLLDDAIQEFRVAMQSSSRRAECLHMVGLCALEAGQPQLAVENFTEQLESPDLSDEHKLAGRFQLGCAYQAMGDLERARSALEAVVALDPNFCDVGTILADLPAAPPDAAASDAGADGGFESFDDVMSEAFEEEGEPEPDPGETFDDLVEEANADESDAADDTPAAPASAPVAERPPEPAAPAAKQPKKKKKISFV
jgi:tetratricopeptide (TPR) repeat protein